jgi:hypothetical protein
LFTPALADQRFFLAALESIHLPEIMHEAVGPMTKVPRDLDKSGLGMIIWDVTRSGEIARGSEIRHSTLMQDHICRIDENLLHRTAGPYIGSKGGIARSSRNARYHLRAHVADLLKAP